MRGTAKKIDIGRGEVQRTIMQSNPIIIIAFHKKNTDIKNLGSVVCTCLSCCMFNLIGSRDPFSCEN